MERDEPEPLPVLDLDDVELGVHDEDRYVTIPPDARRIRRRGHRSGSGTGAATLLIGLLALFLAATWLGGLADDDGTDGGRAPVPRLTASTGAVLVLLGPDGAAVLDVDANSVEPRTIDGLPTVVRDGAPRADGIVTIGDGAHFVELERGEAHSLGAATTLAASGRAAWIGTVDRDGTTRARPVDADGATGDETAVDGLLVGLTGDQLVVARPNGALVLVDGDGATTTQLGRDLEFVAASDETVAAGEAGCAGRPCDLFLVDPASGTRRVVDDAIGQPGLRTASFSPDGRILAITFSDGIVARGLFVETATGSITRFSTDSVRRELASMTWSEQGDWLFLAVERGRIEAVNRGGESYLVDAPLPRFDVLVTAVTGDGSG